MTKTAYNRLSDEDKAKHDTYIAKYLASPYYSKLVDKYTPQVNKMDKSHLTYAICNGANLFGLDSFAWTRLKELGPERHNLEHIAKFGIHYNPDIYEEAMGMLQGI